MKLVSKKLTFSFKTDDTIILFLSTESFNDKSGLHLNNFSFIERLIDLSYFKAKVSETVFLPLANLPNIILCGTGDSKDISRDILRDTASTVTGICRDRKIDTLHIILPEIKELSNENILTSIAEGLSLSNYSFDRYMNNENNKKPLLKKALFYTNIKNSANLIKGIEITTNNTKLCRDLVNDISENSNPLEIAKKAKALTSLNGITCKIYSKNEITKMKMGLLLAVNRGSKIPPQLVVLKYTGDPGNKKHVALVGKGITFDSGGMNLKPSGHIENMRMDMAGAATVLYTIKTAAELKLKKNIYCVMPLTENMLSNDSYRPGDIFTGYNGKTVEIGNTDAEGRLILADAISFTEDKLNPDTIIDIATLTGACVVTFGETVAGFLSNDNNLADLIEDASENTGEKIWRLPLFSEYEEEIKSDIADINNIPAKKEAGTITAATFLKNFINKTNWAHIDIAGTAWYSKSRGYIPKNATGYGVRLLIETLKKL